MRTEIDFEEKPIEELFHVPMIGYHFTSKRNWLRIQKEGFIPYMISKPELDKLFPEGVRGIWIWKHKPEGRNEMGSLLYQMSTKQTHELVLLQVTYSKFDLLRHETGLVNLFHDGNIGDYIYHSSEEANILINPIAPEHISVVKEYDLIKLITA